jgi:hypothetical protein
VIDPKVIEAVDWILKDHVGVPKEQDQITEILELADRRHRRRWGEPIFTEKIDLAGFNMDDICSPYIGGLNSNEKNVVKVLHVFNGVKESR